MTECLKVNFLGTLRSPTSWAHVTRETILSLDERGHDVSVTNCRGFLHDRGFPLPRRLEALMDKGRHTEFEIAFDYPPNYCEMMGEQRAGMLVYETTVLPPHWRDAILEHLHLLVVPSRFEGLGLAILEAFACSRSAIVTGYGGHMQFCNESNAYILDYILVPAGEVQYDCNSPEALIALPEAEHLRALMRSAYEDAETLERKSRNAVKTAADYTWEAAAQKLEKVLLRLKG